MRSSLLRVLTGTTCAALVAGLALATPAAAASHKASPHTKRASSTQIAAVHATAAKKVTLAATIVPKRARGTVAFRAKGRVLPGCGKARVHSGRATCSTTFAAGRHTVHARYSGTSTYRASTRSRTFTVATKRPKATPIVGNLAPCTTTSGALVAVDFARWHGPVVRGCDPNPSTGITLLKAAGFTTSGTQHDGPQFLCRIGHPKFAKGRQYPTPSQDACVRTPPASAYWAHWRAAKGHNSWTYSTAGAYSEHPAAGEVQAWTFGGTNLVGSSGKPAFTPNQVRAGLATAASPRVRAAALRGAPATPDADSAADYLIGQLSGGHYFAPYGGGIADFGVTMDGALALASVGSKDAALRTIVSFLDHGGADASGRTIDDYTGIGSADVSGGAIGKEALLAEVVGRDPRTFGGHDLIKALDAAVCTKAIENVCAAPGNYKYATSTFSQALALIAQLRAGQGATKSVAYLQSVQNASGAFPSALPGSDSDVDSTAMAAMALALTHQAGARQALTRALSWLAGKQESDGGFPGASGDSVNSAAVAVQALRLDARTYTHQITQAESFLAGLQNTDGGFAIAAGLKADGSDIRASAQALNGTVGTPFGSLLDDLAAKTDASSGADYLVDQLTDGDHYTSSYNGDTFDDQGLTADGLFALLASGGHADTVSAMTDYLAEQVDAYADPTGKAGGPYSGSLAKLALAAEATGRDPHSFGGADLLQLLSSNVCAKAIAGDFSPCTAAGDFTNAYSTVSQALGVLALQASPTSKDHLGVRSPAVVRLHQLQCANGGFSSTLIAPGAPCTSDVDTTGYAVQALAAVQGTDTWLGAAQSYLAQTQRKSGLYSGAAGENSNSTALAAQALQSLVGALTSATADPPQPKTVTPIHAWQSALTGLHTLVAAGGGFGLSSASAPDLRASTQAVAAAAQVTLLHLSGAAVLSLPRTPSASPPGSGSPSGSPTSGTTSPPGAGSSHPHGPNGSSTAGPGGTANGGTANTGVTAGDQLAWALLLLLLGAALAYAGRRRVAVVIGQHRTAGRPRRR